MMSLALKYGRMPGPAIALACVVACVPASTARGYTPEEIEQAAAVATDVVETVKQLAADELQGRDNDTVASEIAQRLAIDWLRAISNGLDASAEGDGAFRQPFVNRVRGTNLLSVITGREKPDEYVIVGAHYDHLCTNCDSILPGDSICNGATDNAAGVASVLAIGRGLRSLPTPPRRSVILALWDAEEDGLLGSSYYVRNPLVPLENTVAYLNFDILGSNLLPSLTETSFAIGAETGGEQLQALTHMAITAEPLETHQLSFPFGLFRSDHAYFAQARVPTVFFTDAAGPCYHTSGDEVSVVDFVKLKDQSRTGFRLAVSLAEAELPPSFASLPTLGTYEDVAVLADVLDRAVTDLDRFVEDDQTTLDSIKALFQKKVDEGPDAFTLLDLAELVEPVLTLADLMTRHSCDGFIPVLRAGDADQDLDFDQIDLVRVLIAGKYLTGQPATWGEGDWDGAPGGQPYMPPIGNGLFDQLDIVAALSAGTYLAAPFDASHLGELARDVPSQILSVPDPRIV